MPYLPHNHEWKTQRKLVHQALTPRAVKQHYQIVHEDIAALLCKMMLETPSDFFQHVRLYVDSFAGFSYLPFTVLSLGRRPDLYWPSRTGFLWRKQMMRCVPASIPAHTADADHSTSRKQKIQC